MRTPLVLIALLLMQATSACIQGDDLAVPNNPAGPTGNFTDASWKITYFWDSDHEETHHYSNLTFRFNADGTVTASGSSGTFNGTWWEGQDESTNKLYLNFSSPADLEELSDDWHILEWNDASIRLRDVSGGNGGTDLLTFSRI